MLLQMPTIRNYIQPKEKRKRKCEYSKNINETYSCKIINSKGMKNHFFNSPKLILMYFLSKKMIIVWLKTIIAIKKI